MKRKLMLVLFGAAIVGAASYYSMKAWATPASGFTGITLAKGALGRFEVFNYFVLPQLNDDDRKVWMSLQKTRGDSDLYIQSNTWAAPQPGHAGSAPWRSHRPRQAQTLRGGRESCPQGDSVPLRPPEIRFHLPGGSRPAAPALRFNLDSGYMRA